jgi:hypothetical protein
MRWVKVRWIGNGEQIAALVLQLICETRPSTAGFSFGFKRI